MVAADRKRKDTVQLNKKTLLREDIKLYKTKYSGGNIIGGVTN